MTDEYPRARKLRQAIHQQQREQAVEAFATHLLCKAGDRWWFLRRTRSTAYAASVFADFHSSLVVSGDIDTCAFAYGPEDLHKRLAWIGKTDDVEYYVHQKAAIGMTDGPGGRAFSFDPDVAKAQLLDLADEFVQNGYADGDPGPVALREIANNLVEQYSSTDLIAAAIYEQSDQYLMEALPGNLGATVSSRVFYAWAAVRRLCELLKI